MPYLYGNGIMLREYRNEDFTAIRAWVNDPATVRYLSSRYWMPQSSADTADLLEHATHAGSNGAFFVIADRKTGDYLGQIDLITINWKLRAAEMAIVLGQEGDRGKGVGGEAIALMLAYAFQTLGLWRVELEVVADNRRAVRCYERAGFRVEGKKRNAFLVDGELTDMLIMAVLMDEWREARRAEPKPEP
jgi:RimJ/RimL family protein N-acetyltransferase